MVKKSKSKKKLQDDIRDSASKIWLAGLGAFRVAEQEGSKLFNTLVEEGERFSKKTGAEVGKAAEKAREAGEKVRSEAREGWSRVEKGLDRAVADTLRTMGVPTRNEVESLSRRIEELTIALERLRAKSAAETKAAGATKRSTPPKAPAAKRATPKKATAKKAATKKAATKKKASGASKTGRAAAKPPAKS
jgi:poly(hydroxyalkanoate) granule-associated protein